MQISKGVLFTLLAMLSWTSGLELRFTELVNHIIDLQSREMARRGKGDLVGSGIGGPPGSPSIIKTPGSQGEDKTRERSLTSSEGEGLASVTNPETSDESEDEMAKKAAGEREKTPIKGTGKTLTVEGDKITKGEGTVDIVTEGLEKPGIVKGGTEGAPKINIGNQEREGSREGSKEVPKFEEPVVNKVLEHRKPTPPPTPETHTRSASEGSGDVTGLFEGDKSEGAPKGDLGGITSFGNQGVEAEVGKMGAGGSELKESFLSATTGFTEEMKGAAQPIVWEGWGLNKTPGGKGDAIFAEEDAPKEVGGAKKVVETVETETKDVVNVKETEGETGKGNKESPKGSEAAGAKDIKKDTIREVKDHCEIMNSSSLLAQPVDRIRQLRTWSMENLEKAEAIRETCSGTMFISVLTDTKATEEQRSAAEDIIKEVYKSHPTMVTPKSPEDILNALSRGDLKESEEKILKEILGRFVREGLEEDSKRRIVRFLVQSKDIDLWTSQLLQDAGVQESWREVLLEEGALAFIGSHLKSAKDTMGIHLLRTSWDLIDVIKDANRIPREWLEGAKSVLEHPPEGFLVRPEDGSKIYLDHLMLQVLNKMGRQVPGAGLRFIKAKLSRPVDELADRVSEHQNQNAQALETAVHMLNAAKIRAHFGLFRSPTLIKFIAEHLIEYEKKGEIHYYALANLAALQGEEAKQLIFKNFDVDLLYKVFELAHTKDNQDAMLWAFRLFSWHYELKGSVDKLPDTTLKVLAASMESWASENSGFSTSTNVAYRELMKLFRLAAKRQSLELIPYVTGPVKFSLKLLKDELFESNLNAVRTLSSLFLGWQTVQGEGEIAKLLNYRRQYVEFLWSVNIEELLWIAHGRGEVQLGVKKVKSSSLEQFDLVTLSLLRQMLETEISDERIGKYEYVLGFLCRAKFLTNKGKLRLRARKILLTLQEGKSTKDLVEKYECDGRNIMKITSK